MGAQLVDAAGALASSGGNDELLVEVEPQNGRGRNFFEGLGFESTGERRGTLAVLSKPLPWRPPALVVSVVIALPLLVALGGVAASGDAFDVEGVVAAASALVAQLDVGGALAALADDRSPLVRWRAARIVGELAEGAAAASALRQAAVDEAKFEVAFEIKDAARKVGSRAAGDDGAGAGPVWRQIQNR